MRVYILIGIFISLFEISSAQSNIKGVVLDGETNLPVVGANVYELNTENGVVADFSGRFKLIVNDTSKVKVAFVGYQDVIISPLSFKNDTVWLYPDTNLLISMEHYYYTNTYHVGYYGDLERMPYGFTAHYFQPYLFGQTILLLSQISYKTDFASNYDFKISLNRLNILELNKYKLSSSISYQKRELNNLFVKDYNIRIHNYIINSFHINAGYGIKKNIHNDNKVDHGVMVGISKSINQTLTFIDADITRYKGYSECKFMVLQRISNNKKFWRNLRFGINYLYYKDYDEFNFILRYRNSL